VKIHGLLVITTSLLLELYEGFNQISELIEHGWTAIAVSV
jgi:hypothetical protein